MDADLAARGYCLARSVVSEVQIENLRGEFLEDEPGRRIYRAFGEVRDVIETGALAGLARAALGDDSRPVRAILFDKSPETNWTLGWHQDRVVAVKRRIDLAGFANWTTKWGAVHVEPPFELIQRMVTIRLHCDSCTEENGPLEVIEGSHRLGRLSETQVVTAAQAGHATPLLCNRGDAIILSTPIIHRSGKSRGPARRRVLQVDYAAFQLPAGLEWAYELAAA